MKDNSINLLSRKRIQSIFNRYSVLFSVLTLLPVLLLFSLSLVVFLKIIWIFILIIFLLITFFLPLLNEDFRNLIKNSFNDGNTLEVIEEILFKTYYLPLILTCLSAFFVILSIILALNNRQYTNSKKGLIGTLIIFVVALIFCVIYYLCFDIFIGS